MLFKKKYWNLLKGISCISLIIYITWTMQAASIQEYIRSYIPCSATKAPSEIHGTIISLKKLQVTDTLDFHNMFSRIVRDAFETPKNSSIHYTSALINRILEQEKTNQTLYYGIIDNVANKLIGGIEIREFNKYDNGQLGCWLNEDFWGHGRIQEALLLISKAYFEQYPQRDSYIAHVRPYNIRSLQALKKFGFIDNGFNASSNRHILTFYKKSLLHKG